MTRAELLHDAEQRADSRDSTPREARQCLEQRDERGRVTVDDASEAGPPRAD
jgi:hypothetical protein